MARLRQGICQACAIINLISAFSLSLSLSLLLPCLSIDFLFLASDKPPPLESLGSVSNPSLLLEEAEKLMHTSEYELAVQKVKEASL